MGSLVDGPKTVTELQGLCGLSQSQLSQFLSRMKLEQLVDCRREGRFQFYQAADLRVVELIRSLQKIYC
jgi:DNA-binding transcriptional ArsR family regulator